MKTKEYEKAEICFRQAYRDAKRSHVSTDDLVMCMETLADVIMLQDIIEEPLPLYKKALHLLEKAYGKESVKLLHTLSKLADIYEGEGDWKKATRFIERACEIARNDNATGLDFAYFQHRLGLVRFEQGQIGLAEQAYMTALTINMQQQVLPLNNQLDDLLADYMNILIRTQADEKILRSSLQMELLADRVGSQKKKKAIVASSWTKEVSMRLAGTSGNTTDAGYRLPLRGLESGAGSTGGVTQPELSQTAPATEDRRSTKSPDFANLESLNKQRVAFYERMIASDIDSLGPEHPSVARDLSGLATVYLTQKRYDDAKPLLQRALKIYEQAYPDGSGPVRDTRILLQVLNDESTPSPAVSFHMESLPSIPVAAQRLETALRLNDIAFMLYSRGKIAYSRDVYRWALASIIGAAGVESTLSAASMNDFSRVLRITGSAKQADELRSQAQAIMRRERANELSRLLPGGGGLSTR